MNKQTRKRSKKPLAIVLAAAIVLLAGGTVYAYTNNLLPFQSQQEAKVEQGDAKENDVNYEAPSDDQASAGTDAKKDFVDKKYDTPGDAPVNSAASVAITSINGSSDRVSVRAMVNASDTAGECRLTATGPGASIDMTADLQSQGSYNVCKGFDVALAKGKWTIVIEYRDAAGALSKDQKEYEVK